MKTKTILLFLALAIAAGVFYACKKDMVNSESNGLIKKLQKMLNLLWAESLNSAKGRNSRKPIPC